MCGDFTPVINASHKHKQGAMWPQGEVMSVKHLIYAAVATTLQWLMPTAHAQSEDPNVIVEWNQLLQDTMPAGVSVLQPRYYSILHVAMFDAANSIERDFTKYRVRVQAAEGASQEAAAAQAAHDVLASLIPASVAAYDTALSARLATIPAGRAAQGVRAGKKVAQNILEWRANDGSAATPPPFVLPLIAGLWQPTTPGAPAGFTQFQTMLPFALLTNTEFLPLRHPELTSDRYTTDFNEVKDYGSATSAVRTPDQTQLAQLFAGVITRTSAFAAWNNVARDISRQQQLSLVETARVFALMNSSMHDSLITSHCGKFVYGLWRPLTAIRAADQDLNPNTTADPAWTPLLTTPPYPSYPGNMAGVGASAARALALAFGTNDIPFTVLWVGNATSPVDVPKSYTNFSQFAQDEADSRIYGGIHYRFDNEASQDSSPKVSEYIFKRYMRPLN
jgi:hypothetical protein